MEGRLGSSHPLRSGKWKNLVANEFKRHVEGTDPKNAPTTGKRKLKKRYN